MISALFQELVADPIFPVLVVVGIRLPLMDPETVIAIPGLPRVSIPETVPPASGRYNYWLS